MSRFCRRILIFSLLAAAACPRAHCEITMLPGEVTNFELPRFDENTGAKIWEVFGKKAKFLGGEKIDVADMKLDLFDKSTKALRAVVTSSAARVDASTKIITSPERLFIKGEEFSLSGKEWRWNGDKSTVEIFSDVKVDFEPSQKRAKKADGAAALKKTTVAGDAARFENGSERNLFFIDGSASVRGENLSVDCREIKVVSENGSGADSSESVSEIDARGDVVMLRDRRIARAERVVIRPRADEAEMSGSPEIVDLPSKAKLTGHKIFLLKQTKSISSESSADGKTRAGAVFFHSEKSGAQRKIEIASDSILMSALKGENRFLFEGNVKVKGGDFSASCGKISVSAKNAENEKPEINIIECRGGVRLENADGSARSYAMDIFPAESKTQLRGGVVLNSKDGTRVYAETLTLFEGENRGFAEAGKGGFVVLQIPESASAQFKTAAAITRPDAKSAKSKKPEKDMTVVRSRRLDFARKDNSARFDFEKDVTILSESVSALCGKMSVYSQSRGDKTSKISKIEAFDDVRVNQSEYTANAEHAVIYPKIESAQKNGKEAAHRFVELLTRPEQPAKRPKIILPPLRNLGFESPAAAPSAPRPKMTTIVSDRQWLASYGRTEKYFFEGRVEISATDTKGTCGKIEVSITPPDRVKRREISDIIFIDSVNLLQSDREITCGRAHIYARDEVAVLTRNPVIFNRQDGTRAAGSKIVYNKGSKIVSIQPDADAETDDFSEAEKIRPSIVLPEFDMKKRR